MFSPKKTCFHQKPWFTKNRGFTKNCIFPKKHFFFPKPFFHYKKTCFHQKPWYHQKICFPFKSRFHQKPCLHQKKKKKKMVFTKTMFKKPCFHNNNKKYIKSMGWPYTRSYLVLFFVTMAQIRYIFRQNKPFIIRDNYKEPTFSICGSIIFFYLIHFYFQRQYQKRQNVECSH